jgi:Mg2+/Co2+ transporter CorC
LGKVPAVGDTVEYGPVTVEVLSVAGRRIKQVRASVTPPGGPAAIVEEARQTVESEELTS